MSAALPREPAWGPGLPELALLERAVGYARTALGAVARTAPSAPTPCAAWTVRDLLEHLTESLDALEEVATSGRLPGGTSASPRPGPQACPGALAVVVQDRACAVLAAWVHADTVADPDGTVLVGMTPVPRGVVAATGALEIGVHSWDLARAGGLDHPVPDGLAEGLLGYLPLLVTPADRPGRFAIPLPAPPGAGPGERLLAALGRHPRQRPGR